MLNKKALAGAPSTPPVFVEDVFSTFLYTGTGSPTGITVNNGIDLATKGGLLWCKNRTTASTDHFLFDTSRNFSYTNARSLNTASTAAEESQGTNFAKPETNGFSFGDGAGTTSPNKSGDAFASWTFRKQAKFFDVVTYTGNGANRTIAHNLGSVPGSIWVKRTDTTGAWQCYHRSLANTEYLVLNTTAAKATGTDRWNSTTPTSTVFSLGTDSTVNASAGTYVAYLFAHDAGGFGTAGTDNVISCGSYVGDGTNPGPIINLGYEPQWLMVKNITTATDWIMYDVMRGMPSSTTNTGATKLLRPNTTGAESGGNTISPTATGFQLNTTAAAVNTASETYIYIAIRRGPMKTPTSGTSVFSPITSTQATGGLLTPGFTTDLAISINRASQNRFFEDRLRGFAATSTGTGPKLYSDSTSAESTGYTGVAVVQNTTLLQGDYFTAGDSMVRYALRRAPGFFDVVCYTGTGANQNITHNLGVAPELIICKIRSGSSANWVVWNTTLNSSTGYLYLNDTLAGSNFAGVWNGAPTSTYFTLGTNYQNNQSGSTLVAYLFATLAGVSKVGSYTGNGGTQAIACGFTGGARFVMIKRTDSTGDWYVWDTARNIISGDDPYLLLNSAAAEVTNTDYIDPVNSGFELSSTAPAAINANGGSFIFMAIA